MTELVSRSDDGGVATLTLQRPEVLNALSPALFQELRAHLRDLAAATDAVAVVILRGAGRSFSAGNDLKAISAGERAPTPRYQPEVLDEIESLPQPVIAAVHGHCYTGALELALACDFIIAAESARFADTHGKWGMSPTWGMSQRLPRRIGIGRAREMMYTGRVVTAEEATAIGLAVRCVPDGEFDAAVTETAAAIAANSWFTSRTGKLLTNQSQELPLREGLAYEAANSPGAGPDMADRLRAGGR
jgi:enoyl-CoA hydratase/carnithine racemase